MSTPAELALDLSVKDGVPIIKRVIAGKGKITANFYFTSNNDGTYAGLIFTLSVRDRKGKSVYSKGRNLRKLMKTTKFAHGVLSYIDGKLDFELISGNSAPTLLLKSFKKNLSQKKGLIKLRTARIHRSNEEAEVEEGPLTKQEQEAELEFENEVKEEEESEDFKKEIRKLKIQEAVFGSKIKKQRKHFMNTINIGSELREIIDEQIASIAEYENSNDPHASQKLREARKRLAEATSISSDPYAEDPESVPEEIMQFLKAAYGLSGARLQKTLKSNTDRVREIYLEVKGKRDNENWIAANKVELEKELRACMTAIRNSRLQISEFLKMG